jgi:hypothetical protein
MNSEIRQNSIFSDLSPVQAQVAIALAAGQTVTDAAQAAGVHRSTVYGWLKNDARFQTAFDKCRQERAANLMNQLTELENLALGHAQISARRS